MTDDLFLAQSPGHVCCDLCNPPVHILCFHVISDPDDLDWNYREAQRIARDWGLVLGEPVEAPRPGGCSGSIYLTKRYIRHFIVPVRPLVS
jgi:hypothetical protein